VAAADARRRDRRRAVTAGVTASPVSADEERTCIELLHREARHLDRRELRDWLALYTGDAQYWVPLLEHYSDPDAELNIIFDDRSRLEGRVDRLEGGLAYAQDPPSRTARTLGSVLVSRTGGGFATEAVFFLYELRLGVSQVLAGRYFHELVATPDGLRIRRKTVELVNRTESFANLTFVL
jgi:benzoate/toluate 1,2-dioxygenase subunit beta